MDRRTYTTAEAAAKIGVSRQTLYEWIKSGKVAAPKPVSMGQRSIRFWTDAEIKNALRLMGKTKRRGPKPKR